MKNLPRCLALVSSSLLLGACEQPAQIEEGIRRLGTVLATEIGDSAQNKWLFFNETAAEATASLAR